MRNERNYNHLVWEVCVSCTYGYREFVSFTVHSRVVLLRGISCQRWFMVFGRFVM